MKLTTIVLALLPLATAASDSIKLPRNVDPDLSVNQDLTELQKRQRGSDLPGGGGRGPGSRGPSIGAIVAKKCANCSNECNKYGGICNCLKNCQAYGKPCFGAIAGCN